MRSTAENFREGPLEAAPTPALRALWHAAHENWHGAHEEAQADSSADAAWVHALLHREEGDASNARYWYARAGKPVCHLPLPQERDQIILALLAAQHQKNEKG